MKKDTKTTKQNDAEYKEYLLEVTSKYQEQLQILNRRKEQNKRIAIFYVIIFITVVIVLYTYSNVFGYLSSGSLRNIFPTLAASVVGIYASMYYIQYSSIQSKINQTVSRMRLEEKLYGSRVDEKSLHNSNEEYFSKLVEINIENLSAYYEQVKTHANKSFVAALLMSILGFVIILVGLIISFGSDNNKELVVIISVGSGIITESISALFFYLYTKTVHQMKDYHDGLLYVQNILLSLKLIEGIDMVDPNIKAESINKLVEYLLKQKTPNN
jgi:Na+/H+ antiporter NhaC